MVFQLVPINSGCNVSTDDCQEAIECSTMACAISSNLLASHDRLVCGCELGLIYYYNNHFESLVNLEGNV